MKKTIREYLEEIIKYSEKAQKFTANIEYEEFIKDETTYVDAFRAMDRVIEAVKAIPEDIQKKYSTVPWNQIAKFRNEHFGTDKRIVWIAARKDAGVIKEQTCKILSDLVKE